VALKRQFPRDLDAWLAERGWSAWYHPDYWVHRKMVADPNRQDYTDYGLKKREAYAFEVLGIEPFRSRGLPTLSGIEHAAHNGRRVYAFLAEHDE
jgi:hypothetical protein